MSGMPFAIAVDRAPGSGAEAPVPLAGALTAPQPTPAPMAFRLDATRWTTADRVTGAATLVLFVSLFLPWFSVSAGLGNFTASSSADALAAHGFLYLVLFLALAIGLIAAIVSFVPVATSVIRARSGRAA